MRVVCISDTHLFHLEREIEVPDGDLLIHAGDGTYQGGPRELAQWFDWLGSLPHPRKVVVAGNHDRGFEERPALARSKVPKGVDYLQDSGIEIGGLRLWGAPWQPEFLEWAFNLPRGPRLREKWDLIPAGTDVLITHGPPMGILDMTPRGEPVGCEALREAVRRVKPRLHVFGHIHHAYGQELGDGTRFVNASICDELYLPTNRPVVVDL
jgi:predicted phosphodiesterase